MTKEQFDTYRFSVNTEINFFEDVWDRVTEVEFDKRFVGIERGQIVGYREINNIREREN